MLLDGNNIQASNNSNFAYFNDPKFNKLMLQASLMSGNARYTAYGNLLERDGNRVRTSAPQGLYACAGADQWLLRLAPGGVAWLGHRTTTTAPRPAVPPLHTGLAWTGKRTGRNWPSWRPDTRRRPTPWSARLPPLSAPSGTCLSCPRDRLRRCRSISW